MAYVAGYVTKSLVKGDHHVEYTDGRIPPFSVASNRPGIGADVTYDICSQLMFAGKSDVASIPRYLSIGRVKWPLGRYLRNRIREGLGITKEEYTEYALAKLDGDLQDLRGAALASKAGTRSQIFKVLLVEKEEQARKNKDAKDAIRKQRKKI